MKKTLKRKAGLSDDDWDWFHMAGSTIPWVAGSVAAPEIGLGSKLGSLAVKGAISGTGMGAVEPVTSEETNTAGGYGAAKIGQVKTSAIAGAALGPLGGIAGKVIAPVIGKAQKVLTDAGVKLTGGQLAGGLSRRLEGAAQDYPFIGSLVRNERQNAEDSLQKAVANKALEPIGESVDAGIEPGNDLLKHVGNKASSAYSNSLTPLSVELDDPLVNELSDITKRAAQELGPSRELHTLNSTINDKILGNMSRNGNILAGNNLRDSTRFIRDTASNNFKSLDPYQKSLGGYLKEVNNSLEDALERQVSPDALQNWQNARSSYYRYKVLENAAARAGTKAEGTFTPQDIYSSARQRATTTQKANASAPLLDIAQAAKQVIPDVVRNSGTPERMLVHGALLGTHYISPKTLAAPAILAALYNPVGQAIARHYMMPGIARHGVSDIVRKYLPQTVIPGTTYGD